MAKKTRTELSTLAINTNLPDNTQELITPTTERAQLTDERESVVNYKDDLGGVPNAGKFLTVAVDGESLTMVDAPTGDVTGSGVQYQVAVWDGTNSLTGNAAFQFLTGAQNSIKLIRGTGSGNILFYAADGTTLHGYIENQVSGNGLTIGQRDGSTSAAIDLDDSTIKFKTNSNTHLTISSGGQVIVGGSAWNGVSGVDGGFGIEGNSAQFLLDNPNYNHFTMYSASDSNIYNIFGDTGDYLIGTGNKNTSSFSEKMRISSGGNLGIGITSPTSYNSNGDDLVLGSTSNLSNGLSIVSPSSGDARGNIYFADGTSGSDQTRGFITYKHNVNSMVFGTNDNLALTLSSGGLATFSNGIQFGTGAILDAYEEGTSTIYFRATGQSPTPTTTAYYTRIGNIVYYCFEGTINATVNSNAYFDGLPFLPASGYPRSAFYVGWNSATHNSNGGNVYTSGTYAGTGFFWQRNAFALASYWYTGTQYLTVSGSYQV